MSGHDYNGRIAAAEALERTGRLEEAIHEYAAIAGDFPDRKEAFLSLASLYSRIDSKLDALFCFEKAVSIDPDYLSFFNIGNLYYRLEDWKKAVIFFERSRSLRTDFPLSRLMLGLSFGRMKNFAAAESCFHEVLSLAPENEVAMMALAFLLFERGRFSESEEFANRILLLNPGHAAAKHFRAKLLLRLGRVDDAEEETLSLVRDESRYAAFTGYVAALETETFTDKYGTIDEKIAGLEEKAESSSSLISLSLCYLLKGDAESAVKYLYQARRAARPAESL